MGRPVFSAAAHWDKRSSMKARHLRHAAAMAAFLSLGGGCFGCFAWLAHGIARKSVRERAMEATGAPAPPLITLPGARLDPGAAPAPAAPTVPAPAAAPARASPR
jgi:hypothetical protein